MKTIVSVLVGGLTVGSFYTLVAIGFSMTWATLRSTNFAHGDLFALSGYAAIGIAGVQLSPATPLDTSQAIWVGLLSVLGAAAVGGVTSVATERMIFRPLRNAWHLAAPLATLGVSIAIESAISIWIGSDYKSAPLTFSKAGFKLAGARVTYTAIVITFVAVLLTAVTHWVLTKSRLGLSMRAASWDRPTVALMGVNVNRLGVIAFAVAGTLAGVAGAANTMYYGQITFFTGFNITVMGFTAAVVGGYGSVTGALIGGMVLGLSQAIIGAYVSSAWEQAITFVLLAAVLLLRPTGIIGERLAVRT